MLLKEKLETSTPYLVLVRSSVGSASIDGSREDKAFLKKCPPRGARVIRIKTRWRKTICRPQIALLAMWAFLWEEDTGEDAGEDPKT